MAATSDRRPGWRGAQGRRVPVPRGPTARKETGRRTGQPRSTRASAGTPRIPTGRRACGCRATGPSRRRRSQAASRRAASRALPTRPWPPSVMTGLPQREERESDYDERPERNCPRDRGKSCRSRSRSGSSCRGEIARQRRGVVRDVVEGPYHSLFGRRAMVRQPERREATAAEHRRERKHRQRPSCRRAAIRAAVPARRWPA